MDHCISTSGEEEEKETWNERERKIILVANIEQTLMSVS